MSDSGVPTFPGHVAKAVVSRINSQVDSRLKSCKNYNRQREEKDASFQLFEKMDLQLGDRLGSGGFSDVYEIRGFTENYQSCRSWNFREKNIRENFKRNAIDKNGKSKYVVKKLKIKKMQDIKNFCTAAADLVTEAHFLRNLNHENIINIRGWAAAGAEAYLDGEHDSYFIILDSIEETLDKRIEKWEMNQIWKTVNSDLGFMGQMSCIDEGCGLKSRINVAHQIASAVQYLHSKNIIFRDLKPNNIGFDKNGTVKIFDFGLCRMMPEGCKTVNDTYKMTGRTGTLRYMAPEVALSQAYNQKVDTYSWALLFWYCLSLSKPYPRTTRSQHIKQVCQLGARPALNDEWSKKMHYLLEKSWAHNPQDRFTMVEVCAYMECIQREFKINERTEKIIIRSKNDLSSMIPLPATLIPEMNSPVISMAA